MKICIRLISLLLVLALLPAWGAADITRFSMTLEAWPS